MLTTIEAADCALTADDALRCQSPATAPEGMITSLLPLALCTEICGLAPEEMIIGAKPRPEHELLAARYFHSSTLVKATMRGAMVAAIREALKASQARPAAEVLVALRVMLQRDRSRACGASARGARRSAVASPASLMRASTKRVASSRRRAWM